MRVAEMPIPKECEVCHSAFETTKFVNARTCSRACATKINPASSRQDDKWTVITCAACGQQTQRRKKALHAGKMFCNRECFHKMAGVVHQSADVKSARAYGFKRGYYRTKAGADVKYDSSYELRRMREYDHVLDEDLLSWSRCDFTIPWKDSQGKDRNYNPDFLLTYKDGKKVIEEVKGQIDADTLLKLKAGRAFSAENGYEFKLVCKGDFSEKIDIKTNVYANSYGEFSRPTIESIFMRMSLMLAERSTCLRKKVGAVFVDKRMQSALCIGYNGDESGGANQCESLEPGKCNCLHAELNAISKANVDLEGATLFVTLSPCIMCAKILVNKRISRVIYYEAYRTNHGIRLLKDRGIEVTKYDELEGTLDDRYVVGLADLTAEELARMQELSSPAEDIT